MSITVGTKVRVTHETGIVETGTVFGASVEPITKVRSLTIRFDDDTFHTVAEFRAVPITASLRVHDWAARHLANEAGVLSAKTIDTGGGVLSVEVKTIDNTYLVGFSRRDTGEGMDEAWTADVDPNSDDAWSSGSTAVAAFSAERAADVAFRGGPLDRNGNAVNVIRHPGDDEILPGSPQCRFCHGDGCKACGFTGWACPGCVWDENGTHTHCTLDVDAPGHHEY